jgi:hypothetical protein
VKDLVLSRRQVLKGAGAVGVLGALGIPTSVFADGNRVRWDIMHIDFPTLTISAGGVLSPQAEDLSTITLTGSGTFGVGEDDGVTGGGTWKTFAMSGTPTGNGTYEVTRLVSFDRAPGTLPPAFTDTIGNRLAESAGLAFLRIHYSDGSGGVLTVSCELGEENVFEGVTASKGFVDYWRRVPPATERTIFHILSED